MLAPSVGQSRVNSPTPSQGFLTSPVRTIPFFFLEDDLLFFLPCSICLPRRACSFPTSCSAPHQPEYPLGFPGFFSCNVVLWSFAALSLAFYSLFIQNSPRRKVFLDKWGSMCVTPFFCIQPGGGGGGFGPRNFPFFPSLKRLWFLPPL